MLVFSTWNTSCSKRGLFRMLLPLLRQVVPLNDGNCALRHAFHIGVFKLIKTISITIKHIYTESASIIEGCNVAFNTNDCHQAYVP